MFDLHIHTENSNDSTQTIEEVCESAIAKGLSAIAICDHVDIDFVEKLKVYDAMKACVADVNRARQTYGDRIKILQGMEMAEYLSDPSLGDRFYALCDYDVILGSVHTIYNEELEDSYSRLDWGECRSIEQVRNFFSLYLQRMIAMVEKVDFDVLSHLTCPLRYINGKYHRGLDWKDFSDEIYTILEEIIKRDIALEVNTSGIGSAFGDWLPSSDLVACYRNMGGKLITIGSDAHVPQNVGNAFAETKRMLRDIGFDSYSYYEKRVPYFVKL